MSKILEVTTVEPAALSPKGTAVYLSLSKRTISSLIADQVLIAKQSGGRTACRFRERQEILRGLTREDRLGIDTERASIVEPSAAYRGPGSSV